MNKQRYKAEHLREYKGILTSQLSNGKLKMELKVEDNPVLLERSTEHIESSIELEFYYSIDSSTSFFHHIFSCQKHLKNEDCHECENVKDTYNKTEDNLYRLQIGDTFRIMAALFKDGGSTLPGEIKDFKNYQPLIIAGDEYPLRLADTPEGIKKKVELEEQRLQREQDEKANEEQARKDARRKKRKESIQHFLGKRPNLNQIIVVVIATTIANQVLPRIFIKIYHLLFPN